MKTDDSLLQRYREANDIDTARPSPALRETVLARARAAAQSARAPDRERPAANDAAWRWRALGGLAVLGLATLVVLEFDRGPRQEREVALGETTAPRQDSKASDARPAQTPSGRWPAPGRRHAGAAARRVRTGRSCGAHRDGPKSTAGGALRAASLATLKLALGL